ncbi:hypothetical protein JTE90_007234 [Oedothorax gibbosus]|uniref:Uncharacterized protein n=1 Tax=Oedothorax gibbosus TaxID=931172 RepID=A0AAV6VN20_9ARAC|nr:hypothetical protein JTE90_007234 [Oedothorax gibbosus]
MGRELGRGHPKEIGLNMQSMKLLGLNDGCGENRKASKPLIEKRRRARINYSLAELRAIVVGTEKPHSPTARPPKLEKADILELAVVYVKKMRERQSSSTDGDHRGYASGYNQCLMEVCQFLDKKIDQDLKQRLVMHLNNSSNTQHSTAENSMDDTSSSCSSTSRSQTPASITMETSYMSASPFTDSEQEVPRTFSGDSYQAARQSPVDSNYPSDTYQAVRQSSVDSNYPANNYQHGSYSHSSTSSSGYEPFTNSPTSAMNGPLDLARSAAVRRDAQSFSQAGASSSKSHLGFFNCKMESDSMWRPW